MKGTIRQYSVETGQGVVEDINGTAYLFDKAEGWDKGDIENGLVVRFRPEDSADGPVARLVAEMKNRTLRS